jgi:glutamyl-tRNA(Gln) amidotransferase subunit D
VEDPLHGYSGRLREMLESKGLRVGDRIRISKRDAVYEGILMPRHGMTHRQIVVLKLDNGYNIGVKVDEETRIERSQGRREEGERGVLSAEIVMRPPEPSPDKPLVSIISTGGTIASRVEYETGAVKPALTSRDLLAVVPEIGRHARIEAEVLYSLLSEDMTPRHWAGIVEAAARSLEGGARGVVVTHGTDTMGYTAAALSFAFRSMPGPVVLVGSQRSSDRPSSDAAFNLMAAVLVAAEAPFGEVVVVMHGETGDTYALAHRGTKVRKMHTSRRDAFQSINDRPLAAIWPEEGRIRMLASSYRARGELVVENGFDERVALIKTYPGVSPELLDYLVDKGYHGVVIEATGLGHTPQTLISSIQRATEEGVPIVITSQCLFGRTNLNVYITGRRLLAAGAIPGSDMLPETAYAKLSWILHRTRDLGEVRRLMLTDMAGEINPHHDLGFYPRWDHGV